MQGIDGAGGVEVAVRLLRRGDLLDQSIDVGVELGIWMNAEGVGGALDHFVDVSVVEGIRRIFVVVERLARKRLGGADEIIDASGLLIFLKGERDGDGAVGLDAGRPESVVDMDGGEGYRSHRIIAGLSG